MGAQDSASAGRFAGRHIVVTGAGTGIGRAIATRLSSEGADLTLLARDVGRLEETAASCAGQARALSCDQRDRKAVDAAFAAAAEAGPLYAMVANAGIGGANEPGDEDRFDDLVATNLSGTYHCFRAAQRHLEAGPGARHLVAISSILARIGVPAYTGYCASKAGILGLVRALAGELGPEDIQVNAICPGWVDTAMAREGIDGMAAAMSVSAEQAYQIAMQAVPMGRMSEPEDVAGMVSWLISKDSRGVTGQGLDMNGGAYM
ncbi:MAG: NAD(P)-dependent dehydrogenase (short-subunit alcohol dehydrogenase family) [Planctomycetota bacterium]|jgi:NAD(P)-dependent dehydrogenase (short-subunit alcohol dehydrogenase family)